MSGTIKVGLIGANWGRTHVQAWSAVPDVEIAAICTAHRDSAKAAAAEFGIARACWDWRSLVEDNAIDVIDVTVRPTIRMPIAFGALEAGRHLLQPMPFALDLAQGRRLRDLASASGRVAMVESLHRHAPAFRQMKALLDEGAIGRVHSIRGHVRTGILFAPPPGYVYEWITKAGSGASALRNFGAHLLHALGWMFGPVESVAARLATNMPELLFTDATRSPNETYDSASALMRMASGADAAIDLSWCTPGAEGFLLEAVGDAGRLSIRADGLGPQNAVLMFAEAPGGQSRALSPEPQFTALPGVAGRPEWQDDARLFPLTAMCFYMAQQIGGGGTSAQPSFEEGFAVMRIVEAAYRSHDEGRWVAVAEMDA